jgi:phosphoribosylamine--glycine ligase
MNILIIGGGGREHALAWKVRQSPRCTKLYIAPGNAGTAKEGENVAIDIKNNETVIDFAKEKKIDLVVVGPDDQLAQGMVDALMAARIKAFGPTKAAAKLEWSKAFAKDFMQRYQIPTAASRTFSSHDEASSYMRTVDFPQVIKADGLALGKGVVIAETREEAEETLKQFMQDGKFGTAGGSVVIEEYLEGTEVSIHAFCDGKTVKLFPVARDHKRVGDGDTGPNTGGMGTIVPVQQYSGFIEEIKEKIVMPVIRGMTNEGTPFCGVLFPGLMVTKHGPKVLEFNARFGDPECESYMRLLKTDLVDIMLACIEGRLDKQEVRWSDEYVTTVMLASKGYPEKYEKGFPITGIEEAESDPSVIVYHAGTTLKGNQLVTNGGRVLGVSAVGESPEESKRRTYIATEKIKFDGVQYRRDIGADWVI